MSEAYFIDHDLPDVGIHKDVLPSPDTRVHVPGEAGGGAGGVLSLPPTTCPNPRHPQICGDRVCQGL